MQLPRDVDQPEPVTPRPESKDLPNAVSLLSGIREPLRPHRSGGLSNRSSILILGGP